MIDADEIEALFKKKVIKKGGKKKPKKPEPVSLIDGKRSNNCGALPSVIMTTLGVGVGVLGRRGGEAPRALESSTSVPSVCTRIHENKPSPP